jgi:hypothetical protein
LRKLKAAMAAAAGTVSMLALVPSPAQAAVSCKAYGTSVGSGLNMSIKLAVCRQGNFIRSLQGFIENRSKNYAHTGVISVETNHGESWRTSGMIVAPEESRDGPAIAINVNWSSGHRVCANWMRINPPLAPQHTAGYACWSI